MNISSFLQDITTSGSVFGTMSVWLNMTVLVVLSIITPSARSGLVLAMVSLIIVDSMADAYGFYSSQHVDDNKDGESSASMEAAREGMHVWAHKFLLGALYLLLFLAIGPISSISIMTAAVISYVSVVAPQHLRYLMGLGVLTMIAMSGATLFVESSFENKITV